MANVAKFFVLLMGIIGAVAIALLTGVFGIIELLFVWPFGLGVAFTLDCVAWTLEDNKQSEPLLALSKEQFNYTLGSGRTGQGTFIPWIWLLTGQTSGSHVKIDTSQCRPHSPEDPVVVCGPHPTMGAATGLSKGLMSHFYGPVRWAIKWELMLWFAPVILPFVMAGAGYPLVRESKWLSRFVLRWFGAIRYGLVAIFPDGTRPAEQKGKAARAWLTAHNQADAAAQWNLPLALPRPGGIVTLLAANPTARVVLAVTSGGVPGQSVVADFWRLVFGPPEVYTVTLIDLDREALDAAAAQGDRELGRLLVEIWLKKVFPLLKEGGIQPMRTEE